MGAKTEHQSGRSVIANPLSEMARTKASRSLHLLLICSSSQERHSSLLAL